MTKTNNFSKITKSSDKKSEQLFSYPEESFLSSYIPSSNPKSKLGQKVLLSSQSILEIGKGTQLPYKYPNPIHIYSNSILISSKLSAPGITIATGSISSTSGTKIDASGKSGKNISKLDPALKGNGKSGGNGYPGQSINIYISNPLSNIKNFPLLITNGGDGGNGQDADKGAGGNGGNGGNGGEVEILFNQPLLAPAAIIESLNSLSNYSSIQSAITAALETKNKKLESTAKTLSKVYSSYLDNPGDKEEIALVEAIGNLKDRSIQLTHLWQLNNLRLKIENRYGLYGTYGNGDPAGNSGKNGKRGAVQYLPTGLLTEISNAPVSFIPVHPTQCLMLLNRLELLYFITPINSCNVSSLGLLYSELITNTEFSLKANLRKPIIDLYKENAPALGSLSGLEEVTHVCEKSQTLFHQISKGLDYYGHNSQFAPLISYQESKKFFNNLLQNFTQIEKSYHNYFSKLKQKTADINSIKSMINHTDTTIGVAQINLNHLIKSAKITANQIITLNQLIEPKKHKMNKAIASFKEHLKKEFNWPIDDMLNALSAIAFAPKSKLMWVTQIEKLVHTSETTLQTPQGLQIQKSFIVKKIKTFQHTIDGLKESYKQISNGTLNMSDPGANKLIITEEDFESFISKNVAPKFLGSKYAAAKKAIDDYVSAVTLRNTRILFYNAVVLQQISELQTINHLRKKNNKLRKIQLSEYNANLPELVSFMSTAYLRSRSHVLKALYDLSKAFQFWALTDEDILSKAFSDSELSNPPTINSSTLSGAKDVIISSYMNELEYQGSASQPFKGITYQLPELTVNSIKKGELTLFTIKTATEESKDNPFIGMANVRLNTIRIWLQLTQSAKKRIDKVHVELTQSGDETIVSTSHTPFRFKHSPRPVTFEYNPKTNFIFVDGLIGEDIEIDDDKRFALIGPFAGWTISIPKKMNPDLNAQEDILGVTLEFSGTFHDFD